jgi:hypothetical protein
VTGRKEGKAIAFSLAFWGFRWLMFKKVSRLWLGAIVIALWSLLLGWGIALTFNASVTAVAIAARSPANTTDPIPSRFQPGYETYLQTCTSCHIPIPPEVLPTETWKELLEKPEKHYGTAIPDFLRLSQFLIWDYVQAFSRPLAIGEPKPLYAEQSRYFKALHPRVELPKPTSIKTCVVCHPKAKDFDYRTLAPAWDNAP